MTEPTPSEGLTRDFSPLAPKDVLLSVVEEIWGGNGTSQLESHKRHAHQFDAYFQYYREETSAPLPELKATRKSQRRLLRTHAELLRVVKILKSHCQEARDAIQFNVPSAGANQSLEMIDRETALDLAVRILFMIGCWSGPGMIKTGQIIKPVWRKSESLVQFIERTLPRYDPEPEGRTDFLKVHQLRAWHLEDYANVKIEWTDNIAEHLYLEITDGWKQLRVFSHVGILHRHLQVLSANSEDLSTIDAVTVGCLPLPLVKETLRTISLLFPENDPRSRRLLEKHVQKSSIDHELLTASSMVQHYYIDSDTFAPPEDVQSLYKHYPYWGRRLHRILKEAEDPTPTSRAERFSESKKHPRHMYWAGIIALAAALFFGIMATLLSALQVWISYCSWRGVGKNLC